LEQAAARLSKTDFLVLVFKRLPTCNHETVDSHLIKDAVPEFRVQPDFCEN
jgi:hypothetical protein